ncbi:hypothetical protein HT824_004447 [Salmonella enterica]|jgi:hypothetical protein|nr:hypothetical protein [Salmonella enterica]EFU5258194.1 hypothetical protein [Salmonella enterica]EFU5434227.1 hypothetical protein [Salmonella enterica]
MAFTTQERVDIRRFCWYPVYGGTPSSFQSYRFFQAYGTLEYRLSNLLPEEEGVIRTTYLANLTTLETAIPGTSANLDTDQAAVWTHNKRELADRDALFSNWRLKLCQFLGVPPGPAYSGSGGSMQLVV